MNQPLAIAVVGGTGPPGPRPCLPLRPRRPPGRPRLARCRTRWREGRRDQREVESPTVTGATNAAAAAEADVILLAVPWDGHADLVAGLADQPPARS
ncbi:NAD(P)-binding domain-containing protein [Aeromicrobium sp. UC242_57]|uniref:NAD(P)-binding domain-containing protein n=1 Tax=Aeromicrobium sp. UC242_57 TaxID=3374624 RepID=UPI0037AFF1EC